MMATNLKEYMDRFIKPNVVVKNPTLDLDDYVNDYTSFWRYYRLIFIAEVSPTYRLEALKKAIYEVMTHTANIEMCKVLFHKLNDFVQENNVPADDLPVYDEKYFETILKESELTTKSLETDLKNMKSSFHRNIIGQVFVTLAEHCLNCGQMSQALKHYLNGQEYCTTRDELIHLKIDVLRVRIFFQQWTTVLDLIEDPNNFPNDTKYPVALLATELKCFKGLAELQLKNYKTSALAFLSCDFNCSNYFEFLSKSNLATYVVICAMATFNRDELMNQVLKCHKFKSFLELIPQLTEVAENFTQAKYAFCLNKLEEMRDNLLLDMYLSAHLDTLYARIRFNGLIQYCYPYDVIDMHKMAKEFNVSCLQLEDELEVLISNDQLAARIDSCNKKLMRHVYDPRKAVFERALAMGTDFQRRSILLKCRQALARANIIVMRPDNPFADKVDDELENHK